MSLTAAVAMAFSLGGCADESPWGNNSNEKGSISITLGTDSDITTAKPVFRSGDDETRATSGMLADYITVPTSDDFSIRLEKADGTYSKTWATLADFKTDAVNGFSTGTYTLTAFYGEKGVQDFENPYFEASSTFNVFSEQTSNVELTAELKNSMVKVNYTDNFKAYMQDYHSSLRTEGRSDEIVFSAAQTKPAFIEPIDATLTVHFTTKDKGFTSSVVVGQFPPQAKTLHNMTLDIGENKNGDATLSVTFDDTLEDETFTIDLTEELLTTPAPVITCEGFTDGQTVDMLEGSASETQLKMNIFAEAGIKSALMTVESTAAYKPAWGYEIDLCSANEVQQAQLNTAGIQAIGLFHNPEQMALLDLTEYGKSLQNGVYAISLIVTDIHDAVSKTTKVILNSLPISIELIGDPTIVYNSDKADLTFDYNGLNPMQELTFTAEDDFGNDQDCQILSCEETNTRAFETKRYIFYIKLPCSTRAKIKITVYHNHNKIGTYEVPVIVPQYNISAVDAFSQYAYIKVATPSSNDPNVLATVTNNIQLRSSDKYLKIEKRDVTNGILTVTGLTPGSTYAIESTITGGDIMQPESLSIDTEEELSIPNGDFEDLVQTINTTINQGGQWTQTDLPAAKRYTTTLSMIINEPKGWFSSNPTTCNLSASNVNSWYVIPSVYNTTLTWLSNQPEAKVMGIGQDAHTSTAEIYKNQTAKSGQNAMVIRNVAWDHSGAPIPDDQKTGKTDYSNYYCSKPPSIIANKTAGFLKLGSSSAEGTDFSSRPKKLKGFFKYQDDSNGETGVINVKLLNGSTIIGSGTVNLGHSDNYTAFEIPINYNQTIFAPKATKLQIEIYSSNATSIKTNNHCNKEECCSRGATLYVDNLTFEY